ncbi:hypothetical protein [Marinifilum breve]|uniref:hypothetical protein n=1 Tax=Marinifilum breve TaxID=2184082 RepID=UPI001401E778|nr:hypothetical protein [Marinifilum breve]
MRKLLLACLLLACVKLNAQEQINTSPIYFQNGDISIGITNIRTSLYLFSNRQIVVCE